MLTGIIGKAQEKSQANNQDLQWRQAAKSELGIDLPIGMGKLYPEMVQKKFETAQDLSAHPERTAMAKMFETGQQGSGGDVVYRDVVTGQEVPQEKAVADISAGNTNYTISRKEISKSGIKEVPVSKPADLANVQAKKDRSDFIVGRTQDALNTIAEVKAGKKYFGAVGPVPTVNPWGYERKKWEANVNKLLSGKMIELMTQMKEASKTGATGFGQLSEREGQILRDASTALNRGLSPDDAEKYLTEMEGILQKVINKNSTPGMTGDILQDRQQVGNINKTRSGLKYTVE
jgi:hypothetical protein